MLIMTTPSIDICWRIAEAEGALAGYPVIEPAHFWIGVCKAADGLRQKTSRHKTQEKRKRDAQGRSGRWRKKKYAKKDYAKKDSPFIRIKEYGKDFELHPVLLFWSLLTRDLQWIDGIR